MEEIRRKIEQHEIQIQHINSKLDEVVEYNKDQNIQLRVISESLSKQEILLEKITNLESKYENSTKRLHNRVDDCESQIKEKKHDMAKELNDLKEKVEKLSDDVKNRPCVTHNVVENELKHINDTLATHKKIFWTTISTIMVIIIGAIVKGVLK